MFKETDKGILISFKISPNASRNEIIRAEDGVKIKITAQPIDNKANKALVEFISKQFKIPKTSIEIVKGQTSKEKTLLIIPSAQTKIEEIENLFK